MIKEDFISIVESHSKFANIFDGRFVKIEENKFKWEIPAVETYNQYIIINDDCVEIVKEFFNENEKTKLTFDEIIKKFNLIK
jgi:hypothetical protein